MVTKGFRARVPGAILAAGVLSLLIGAAGLGLRSGSDLLAAPASLAAAPRNNGIVTINGVDTGDLPPTNNPHVGCTFVISFYNFDEGPYYARVMFMDQLPTQSAGPRVVSGDLNPFIG